MSNEVHDDMIYGQEAQHAWALADPLCERVAAVIGEARVSAHVRRYAVLQLLTRFGDEAWLKRYWEAEREAEFYEAQAEEREWYARRDRLRGSLPLW